MNKKLIQELKKLNKNLEELKKLNKNLEAINNTLDEIDTDLDFIGGRI